MNPRSRRRRRSIRHPQCGKHQGFTQQPRPVADVSALPPRALARDDERARREACAALSLPLNASVCSRHARCRELLAAHGIGGPLGDEHVFGEQFGEQIERNRDALGRRTPNKHGAHQLRGTPSLGLGAGRSQVQILSPRYKKDPRTPANTGETARKRWGSRKPFRPGLVGFAYTPAAKRLQPAAKRLQNVCSDAVAASLPASASASCLTLSPGGRAAALPVAFEQPSPGAGEVPQGQTPFENDKRAWLSTINRRASSPALRGAARNLPAGAR
jgi:hypothetical protein